MWYRIGILGPWIRRQQMPGESHLESAAAACAPVLAGTLPKAGAMKGTGAS